MEKSISNKKYKAFLQLLVEIRKRANVTQVELAEKLGTDQSTISKMERGERRIDIIELREICRHINLSIVEFVANLETRLTSRKKIGNKRLRR